MKTRNGLFDGRTKRGMKHRMRRYRHAVIALSSFFFVMNGCVPAPQTPGHRPEVEVTPQAAPTQDLANMTPEWAYQQGIAALNQRALDEAIQYFQLAAQRDAMYLQAYIGLGDVYTLKDEYLLAESFYEKVLKYDPDSVAAYLSLGKLSSEKGDVRQAISFCRKALELEPSNAAAQQQLAQVTEELFAQHYEQGTAYKDAGDIENALVEFQKAHSLKSDDIEFTVEIGDLFLRQNDYMMADGFFQQALAQNPNFLPAMIGAGKAQLGMKNFKEAAQYFKNGQAIAPENPELGDLLKKTQTEKIRTTLPSQYTAIASAAQVTRGEVAAMLLVELNLEERLPAPSRRVIISDITTHWAKPYIIKAVQYDVIGLPPDRYFRPDEPMLKGELAQILDMTLQKRGIPLSLATSAVFSDVHQDNQYADSILRVVSAGIMDATNGAAFGIANPVSGAEMKKIISRVKKLMP